MSAQGLQKRNAPDDAAVRVIVVPRSTFLKGAKTGEPIEFPAKLEPPINLNTAKVLGMSIPDKMPAIADELVE